MLIEDSAVDRKYLELLVKIKGLPLQVISHDNPEQALAALRREGWPDILLIDINIPLLTGFELLDELFRAGMEKPATSEVYVNSASSRLEDRRRAEEHPLVDGFFEKPIREHHLLQIIERLQSRVRTS
jgi:CheY-like chemotaxis protein